VKVKPEQTQDIRGSLAAALEKSGFQVKKGE